MTKDIIKEAAELAARLTSSSEPEEWKRLEELKQEMNYEQFRKYIQTYRAIQNSEKNVV